MSEINTENNWWKLEDSWKKITTYISVIFGLVIVIALLFVPLILTLSLFGSGVSIEFILIFTIGVLIFMVILIIFVILLMVNQIGIAIKLHKIQRTLPDEPGFRKIFAHYLVGMLVPVVGPVFWAKSINNIMKYLDTQKPFPKAVEYVENKGKIYSILGVIIWGATFVSGNYFSGLEEFVEDNIVTITRGYMDFLIVFFSILGIVMLILSIFMVMAQIGILKRLTDSIHDSGLY